MVSFRSLTQLALAAATASATSVIVPLYVYPGAGAWDPVYNAITSNPNVQFQLIVNPSSGPGDANSFPNSDYTAAISKLNSYSNVELVGYVRTNYTNRAIGDVHTDVSTYANWATYSAANIAVRGIFFDEAPYQTGDPLSYMADASGFTKNAIANPSIVFNPGTSATDVQYFDYATSIVEFENFYSSFQGQATIDGFPADKKSQSSVILHDFNGDSAALQNVVNLGFANDLASVYLTQDCCYNSLSFVPNVAAAFSQA